MQIEYDYETQLNGGNVLLIKKEIILLQGDEASEFLKVAEDQFSNQLEPYIAEYYE